MAMPPLSTGPVPTPLPPPRQLRLRLEPTLGPTEREYRLHYLATDIAQAWWVVAVTVLAFLLANLLDLYGERFSREAVARLLIFGAQGTFTVAVALVLRRIRQPAVYDWLMLSWLLAYVTAMLYLRMTRVPIATEAAVVLIAFGSYTVIPNRLLFRALPALMITVGDLWILSRWRGVPPIQLAAIALVYGFTHLVGAWVSIRQYTVRREQFLGRKAEEATRTRLEDLANTDALTGLLSRRRWFELAEVELSRQRRHRRPFALMIADLDHFKRVNDLHGHQAGDGVLRHFALILHRHRRQSDLVGRLGGEEFGLLLPETGLEAATEVAERIVQACREAEAPTLAGPLPFTCSIGVTAAGPDDQSLDVALVRADDALYLAKQAGRDRVETAPLKSGDPD